MEINKQEYNQIENKFNKLRNTISEIENDSDFIQLAIQESRWLESYIFKWYTEKLAEAVAKEQERIREFLNDGRT